MPKATEAPTTLASTSLPPVIDLGRRIASLQREHDRLEQVSIEARGNRRAQDKAKDAMGILCAQMTALRALIATTPALSMSDAAVQVAEAFMLAEDLEANETPPERLEAHATSLTKMLLSILPIVIAAAGLDAVEMGWEAEVTYLRERRFAALQAVV